MKIATVAIFSNFLVRSYTLLDVTITDKFFIELNFTQVIFSASWPPWIYSESLKRFVNFKWCLLFDSLKWSISSTIAHYCYFGRVILQSYKTLLTGVSNQVNKLELEITLHFLRYHGPWGEIPTFKIPESAIWLVDESHVSWALIIDGLKDSVFPGIDPEFQPLGTKLALTNY